MIETDTEMWLPKDYAPGRYSLQIVLCRTDVAVSGIPHAAGTITLSIANEEAFLLCDQARDLARALMLVVENATNAPRPSAESPPVEDAGRA